MEAAFERLTEIQKENINQQMFVFAYNCLTKSKGDPSVLEFIIDSETANCPHLRADLVRYCKLVNRVK